MTSRGAGGPTAVAGPRVPRPMYEPINTSKPSATDLELDAKLEAFMTENVPIMSKSDLRRREVILGKIRGIFLKVRYDQNKTQDVLFSSTTVLAGFGFTESYQ